MPMHIIQRGNNRSACFRANVDYARYLRELEQLAALFRCQVHAYVLMTNHVHLLLTPELTDSVSMLMKNLGQRYVQYVNRTYHRSGTRWEGRFRSCIAQEDSYRAQLLPIHRAESGARRAGAPPEGLPLVELSMQRGRLLFHARYTARML
jgi:REP element-mobilizing transposase RayT